MQINPRMEKPRHPRAIAQASCLGAEGATPGLSDKLARPAKSMRVGLAAPKIGPRVAVLGAERVAAAREQACGERQRPVSVTPRPLLGRPRAKGV